MRNFIQKYRRHLVFFFLINFITQVFMPTVSWALTSGPSQPEVQEFKPIDVADMVNPFTGDFSYNIPLMDVDGYPVNISYGGAPSMDQEATCVGLGWNINTGSISRGLRGLPDDFNGEDVTKEFNIKDNETYGVTLGVGGELFGVDVVNANVSMGVTYNNYSGYNITQKVGFSISLGDNASVGLGVASSGDGLTLSPNVSLSAKTKEGENGSLSGSVSLGTSFNSRTGMKELSLSVSVSNSHSKDGKKSDGKTDQTRRHAGQKDENKPGSNSNPIYNNSSSIGFGSPTWVPQITMPLKTKSIFGSFKIGGTLFGVDISADIAANYSKQRLATKSISNPAYGYLYMHNGQNSDDAMLDFNREKDGNFTEATTNLPIPNLTYDNFSVMGQGVGGSYRPYRSDFGYVFDPRATTTSESDNISLELDLGNTVHAGIDFVNTTVNGSSGKWTDENNALNFTKFTGSGNTGYEPAYFKEQGEMNIDDDNLYNALHSERAIRFNLDDRGSSVGIQSSMIDENSSNFTVTANTRSKRVKRNQYFSYLTLGDAKKVGLQTALYNPVNQKINAGAQDHHIAEIVTTKTDGTRYVYGLPVYNSEQKESSFAVGKVGSGGAALDQNTNLVTYSAGSDNTTGNQKGVDNFYTSTKTKAYAYGYMLTAVLSADYVDRSGNGPTVDDIGTYTLFNYDVANKVTDYQWRTPYAGSGNTSNSANFDEGLLTDKDDSKGSYVYGKKDLFYLSSIQTKKYIAFFTYSDRNDGIGVAGEQGTRASNKYQQKLDLITLYSTPDYALSLSTPGYQPFIIKQVHFNYDYSLCDDVYNNDGASAIGGGTNQGGKLTLKEIYFTYGNSFKGKLSPYRFTYNTTVTTGVTTYTPTYNPNSVDRWGVYKPNNSALPNSKYPYTPQVKADVDTYARLWMLKSIQLPSGGVINVEAESDDYAYIQDKRAGQMFKIIGASDTDALSTGTDLYDTPASPGTANTYLFFEKDPAININEYFQGVDKLYFRFFTKVNYGSNGDVLNVNSGKGGYEFVNGYCDIESYGQANGNSSYGYVKVKKVRGDKTGILVASIEHPISKAAWQFGRLKTPKDAYSANGGANPASGMSDVEQIFRAMADASFLKNTIQFFQGPNGALKAAGLGQPFDPTRSWVRLSNPNYHKIGGGYRIKTIKISDKWNAMLSSSPTLANQTTEYGQEYSYETVENGKTISSGVAAYEPSMGADENSFRQPVFMDMHKEEALLAPDNDVFVEQPFGESFFPPPTVGYSKVTIKSLQSGSGKTVNEFFTARDFPTIVHTLGMDASRKKPNPIFKLFSFSGYDKFTGSQGYSIEINDMHGKQRAIHNYEEGSSAPIASTIYHYKTDGQKLVNEVKAMTKNGAINNVRVGVDYDMYADFRENNTTTEAIGIQGQLYFFWIGPIPGLVPPILPTSHTEEIQLRTAVINKVIYRYGIIDRVDNVNNSEISSTENLLWDGETGEVLLTSTTTEFKDPIYTMKYPAYWAYDMAAGAYKNTGLVINSPASIVDASGKIINTTYKALLHPGDEIAVYTPSTIIKAWVHKVGNDLYFINQNGVIATQAAITSASASKIKVIRSGRRNLQQLNVGATTTFTNPLTGNPSSFPVLNQNYGVLNASAIEMGSSWQTYCQCDLNVGQTYNPYLIGTQGNLRTVKQYSYLSTRKQEKTNGNSNIRIDGTLSKFSPFWAVNSGNDWTPMYTGWTWSSEVTKVNPMGSEIENKDALNRYSAAQFGFIQTLPVAITSNSRFKQMANESFEYSDLTNCADDHLGFNQFAAYTYMSASAPRVQKHAHTGKRSIKVEPGDSKIITKQLQEICND